jgi:hypothetical protein
MDSSDMDYDEAAAIQIWSSEEVRLMLLTLVAQNDSTIRMSWPVRFRDISTALKEQGGYNRTIGECSTAWQRFKADTEAWDDNEGQMLVSMTNSKLTLAKANKQDFRWTEHWKDISSALKTAGYSRCSEECGSFWLVRKIQGKNDGTQASGKTQSSGIAQAGRMIQEDGVSKNYQRHNPPANLSNYSAHNTAPFDSTKKGQNLASSSMPLPPSRLIAVIQTNKNTELPGSQGNSLTVFKFPNFLTHHQGQVLPTTTTTMATTSAPRHSVRHTEAQILALLNIARTNPNPSIQDRQQLADDLHMTTEQASVCILILWSK